MKVSEYGIYTLREFSVDWNGFNFLVIYGRHVNGWFIAIPNWNICVESAGPTEDFYNTEKLSMSFNKITAEVIATAIKEHWEGLRNE